MNSGATVTYQDGFGLPRRQPLHAASACTALDACHVPGVCNASTGTCPNRMAANGTACNDGNACTQTDDVRVRRLHGREPRPCLPSRPVPWRARATRRRAACSNPTRPTGRRATTATPARTPTRARRGVRRRTRSPAPPRASATPWARATRAPARAPTPPPRTARRAATATRARRATPAAPAPAPPRQAGHLHRERQCHTAGRAAPRTARAPTRRRRRERLQRRQRVHDGRLLSERDLRRREPGHV